MMMIEKVAAQAAARQGAGKDSTIGRMLLEMGKITQEDATRVLALQAEKGLRFGQAAQQLGLVTEADILQVLSTQFNYQYVQANQSTLDPSLLAALDPFGAEAEALRALRGQLNTDWFVKNKTLAVLAVDGQASADVVAANLAVVFAQQGQKTLLVDADLRAPRQQDLFNVKVKSGLSDALAGRTHEWGMVQVKPFDTLSLLCAGPQPPNPHELLGRPTFAALNDDFARNFDVVLYGAPAFTASSDAYAVAALARGVLLVVSRNVARQKDVREVRTRLQRSGVEIVGSILVDF